MNYDRFISIEQMEQATELLLENGRKVGAVTMLVREAGGADLKTMLSMIRSIESVTFALFM